MNAPEAAGQVRRLLPHRRRQRHSQHLQSTLVACWTAEATDDRNNAAVLKSRCLTAAASSSAWGHSYGLRCSLSFWQHLGAGQATCK